MRLAAAQCSLTLTMVQALTDMLSDAALSLSTAAVEEGDQNADHMLTILHGLKGEK